MPLGFFLARLGGFPLAPLKVVGEGINVGRFAFSHVSVRFDMFLAVR